MLCNNILQDLQKKGRLGENLKGINKKILGEIESQVTDAMDKEMRLLENRSNFKSECEKLGQKLK